MGRGQKGNQNSNFTDAYSKNAHPTKKLKTKSTLQKVNM